MYILKGHNNKTGKLMYLKKIVYKGIFVTKVQLTSNLKEAERFGDLAAQTIAFTTASYKGNYDWKITEI